MNANNNSLQEAWGTPPGTPHLTAGRNDEVAESCDRTKEVRFAQSGQNRGQPLASEVRVVCICDAMAFVLHVVRACPCPQTTSLLASVCQTMSPDEWANVNLKGAALNVKNKWWGERHDDGEKTTCCVESLALGNEFDTGDLNCKEDVNDCWVICIKHPEADPALVDPDDAGIVENDPCPPEDENFYCDFMTCGSVLECVDKEQANYKDLCLPKKSLVSHDAQARIDHEPSTSLQTVVSHH